MKVLNANVVILICMQSSRIPDSFAALYTVEEVNYPRVSRVCVERGGKDREDNGDKLSAVCRRIYIVIPLWRVEVSWQLASYVAKSSSLWSRTKGQKQTSVSFVFQKHTQDNTLVLCQLLSRW